MKLHFKTAAGLLLLIQLFHLASFQHSTNSPAMTIDKNWLRELVRNASLDRALAENGLDYDERGQSHAESGAGIPSGAMAIFPAEDENLTAEGSGEEGDMLTSVPVNVTFTTSEPPGGNTSSTSNVGDRASESIQVNATETTEVLDNRTATPQSSSGDLSAQNATSAEDLSNHTNSTTASPLQGDVTDESTPAANKDWNSTGDSASTVPDIPEATAVGSDRTVDQTDTRPVTPTTSLKASTAVDVSTPEGANKTGKVVAEGSSSDRGMTSSGCNLSDFWFTFNLAIPLKKQPFQVTFKTSHSIRDTITLPVCTLFFFSASLTHIYRLFFPLPLLEDQCPLFEKGKVG